MHDIRTIRDNPQAFDAALVRRGLAPLSASLLAIDETRRAAIHAAEQALARRNAASKDIGAAKKAKDEARASALMAEVGELKTRLPQLEAEAKAAEEELRTELAQIPNLPLAEVPEGRDEHDNVEHHHYGRKRDYAFTPKPHYDLGEALGQMDFNAAAKLSGARFVVLKNRLARLERAIGQFFLDVHTGEHGYTEVNPPLLVRDDAMFGTAQLPKFREDQFAAGSRDAEGQGYWLIPTAEVPLTNLVRNHSRERTADAADGADAVLPRRSGAAGRDTRGYPQHQFTRSSWCRSPRRRNRNEHGAAACAGRLRRWPTRVMTLCTGDMASCRRPRHRGSERTNIKS